MPSELYIESYAIQQAPPTLYPFEIHDLSLKLSIVIAWTLWVLYTILCFRSASSIQDVSPQVLWQLWLILLAEFFLTFQDAVTALNLFLGLFSPKETAPRPGYRLSGDSAPTVDVLVTCCGEPVDVITDTVAAVSAQDYPTNRLRVFLLDDGRDEQLRHAVARLNARFADTGLPNVTYLSREQVPGVQSYFKAGNLQFGINESDRLGGSEILAGLDADMIPEREWLRRMVPHLLLDRDMALACPPQQYYNVPGNDPLGQQADFEILFTVLEPLNDRLGAAMCTGSGYVVRRSALEDIGGWPLAETGEDYMCSAILGNAGWKVAFIREKLQWGLAPDSLRAMVKQRMRWVNNPPNPTLLFTPH
ncbi:MAG: hypothetical protein Q9166_006944 [cf. Caloplaca sp. 2 TL-2023]